MDAFVPMSNTVFILGAGFSAPARMPVQADIMRNIVTRVSQERTRNTIKNLFKIIAVEHMLAVPLEDLFTVLDRARNAKETLVGFSHEELEDSYRTLIGAIISEFDRRLSNFADEPYNSFFSELINKLKSGIDNQAIPPFSVVTLNWDTIPDYLVKKLGTDDCVEIDYGCYNTRLEEESPAQPDTHKTLSLRLLKVHGSLNWLTCTSCGRLFISNLSNGSPPVLLPLKRKCRFCFETPLESLIITPTLVKNVNATHLNSVWHHALLELQEAKRIVFVGYSLPLADFEFRYLLLRALIGSRNVSVRVVLYPPDSLLKEDRQRFQREDVECRYRNFFGARDVDFKYLDASEFMTNSFLIWHW